MADEHLQVELVAADRTVWSGQAQMVIARTAEGDVGILRGHTPILSLLISCVVEITEAGGEQHFIAVDDGFLSVANDRVSILSEHVLLAHEIDLSQAEVELEEARRLLGTNNDAEKRIRRAEARIRAVEKAS